MAAAATTGTGMLGTAASNTVTDPTAVDPNATGMVSTSGAPTDGTVAPASSTTAATPASSSNAPGPNMAWDAATSSYELSGTNGGVNFAGTPGNNPAVSTYSPTNATASLAHSQGYTATPITQTPGMLVSNQLSTDLNPNSQLMTQAATAGNEQANARGLDNSSLGISAAQSSMINAALPVAEQDAGMVTGVNTANAGAINAASQFTSAAANTAALQNAQLLTNVSETNAGAANAAAQFGAGAANTAAITGANISSNQLIANLQASTTLANTTLTGQNAQALQSLTATDQQQLAALNSQYSNLLQTNQNAATSMAQYVATVTAINTGTGAYASTTQATKGTDIQSAFNTLQSSLQGLAQQAPGAVNPGSNFTNPATTPPAGTANNADYTIGGVTYVNSNGVGIPIPATETVT